MKNKSKHAHLKRKKEFRFHKIEIISKKGKKNKMVHPAYVFLEKGNLYIYVTITHSSQIEGKLIVKLCKNPNPYDERDSYFVDEIKYDTKDTFGRKQNKWSIDDCDDARIRESFEKKKR